MRNLIRRFVESGVPGYHIEDQRPGTKKCGHQGGKVLVPSDEQIKRLNTARFQLDIMRVPGIIVARTDAEAANLLDSRADERDQPFLLGATNLKIPSYKACFLAMMRSSTTRESRTSTGTCSTRCPTASTPPPTRGCSATASKARLPTAAKAWQDGAEDSIDALFDKVESKFVDAWQVDAGLQTYGEAVGDLLDFREREGEPAEMSAADWRKFAGNGAAVHRAGEGQGVGRRRRMGPRTGEDAGRLLPDPRRHPVRDRQVAGRRAVRRHPLDGDQDRRSGRRQAVRRRDPRRVPRPDAGLQPVPLVQLGHHRHDRRRDAGVP